MPKGFDSSVALGPHNTSLKQTAWVQSVTEECSPSNRRMIGPGVDHAELAVEHELRAEPRKPL